ncbi:MAG: nicotinate-nucleotide adenylyltransferase [Candidatus Goldiibacteriota bacterium]
MDKVKKAAIFGGTFNPPHIGHFMLAKEAMKKHGLDKVFFVPSFLPPHKNGIDVIKAAHREEMVKRIISGEPSFLISEYELNRKTVSYTIDTVRFFMTEFPDTEFYYLMGSDAFYGIKTWKESEKLIRLMKFIVYKRQEFPKEKVIKAVPEAVSMLWMDNELINISSSDIRKRIRSGENMQEETGKKVWEYIEEKGLYR